METILSLRFVNFTFLAVFSKFFLGGVVFFFFWGGVSLLLCFCCCLFVCCCFLFLFFSKHEILSSSLLDLHFQFVLHPILCVILNGYGKRKYIKLLKF